MVSGLALTEDEASHAEVRAQSKPTVYPSPGTQHWPCFHMLSVKKWLQSSHTSLYSKATDLLSNVKLYLGGIKPHLVSTVTVL